ncbi:MAG: PEP-CTERM sorting domain-containing protein [Verrucomicrobiota bacterium JB023]|nr:PEP-CTERM sorting domain-containing protein [Verrucomicrobiota bacterium JB023]
MKLRTPITIALLATTAASQAVINVSLPGTTTTDGWDELVSSRLAGYGGYPGLSPWPGSVPANVSGSSNAAEFGKTSGAGYFGTNSFYDGGNVGSLNMTSTTVLSDLETIVFQVDMGASSFTSSPSLLVNGSTQLSPVLSFVTEGDYSYSFGGPVSSTENHVFQWDLTGLGSVSDFEVQWDTASHTTIFAMQLDTGDEFVAIPEPSTALLTLFGLPLFFVRKRRG